MLKCMRMETYRVGIVRISSQREKTKTCVQVTGTNTGMELLWIEGERKGERMEREERLEEGRRDLPY